MGMLTILFIGLKLAGYIDWSWWWVVAPLWIPVAVFLAICVLAIIGILGAAVFEIVAKLLR